MDWVSFQAHQLPDSFCLPVGEVKGKRQGGLFGSHAVLNTALKCLKLCGRRVMKDYRNNFRDREESPKDYIRENVFVVVVAVVLRENALELKALYSTIGAWP